MATFRTVVVCSTCGRTTENTTNTTRGWLIDSHKSAEKAFNGEMVIRCPKHITDYAVQNAERGRAAIRKS